MTINIVSKNDAIKYIKPENNININIKENNNGSNYKNNNEKKVNFIIKNYIGNSIKINQNNNINIFKNYSNIYNSNNIKPLFRESTSDYTGTNNFNSLSSIQQIIPNNIKEFRGMSLKSVESIKKKDNLENINKINGKEKERENNILNNINNKKSFLSNLRNEKLSLNFANELLSLKKSLFKNKKLPKLKLKYESK